METASERWLRKLNLLIEAEGGADRAPGRRPGHYRIAEIVIAHEGGSEDDVSQLGQTLRQYAKGKAMGEQQTRRIEAAYEALRPEMGIRKGWFDDPTSEIWSLRDKSTQVKAGTPGITWHTTDVNPNTKLRDQVQIWHLPLVPLERIELAGEPNMTTAVQALPTYPVTFGGAPYDPESDKVLILEMDVDGTIAKKGHVAVFRSALGRKARQTNRPIIVKNERGEHVMVSYSTYAGMSGVELVAVCIHSYQPMDCNPFV